MTQTMLPAQVAKRLRIVADLLELADPVEVTTLLLLQVPGYPAAQAERVEAVDAMAAALGLSAEPTHFAGVSWQHRAEQHGNGFLLALSTAITGRRLCACGTACTHTELRAEGVAA